MLRVFSYYRCYYKFTVIVFQSELRPQSLHEVINPSKNWRHVSIEWDESQRRIFGGRIID